MQVKRFPLWLFLSRFGQEQVSKTLWQWQRMATKKEKLQFPPQTQPQQPGKEYPMHPLPQHINPDYKPSNKLHVRHCSALKFFCLHILFQLEQQVKDLLYIQFRGRERLLCLLSFCTTGDFTYVGGIEDRDMVDALKLILGAMPTDVSIEETYKSVVDHVVREYGRIDILVNNAAVHH